jgi:hypothetical protein
VLTFDRRVGHDTVEVLVLVELLGMKGGVDGAQLLQGVCQHVGD